MSFTPRPHQQKVLEYRGGYMGVAAVPGSGKTATLSALAARLVGQLADEELARDRLTADDAARRSTAGRPPAAGSTCPRSPRSSSSPSPTRRWTTFPRASRELVRAQGLVPGIGYRVRTLHSLALDIIRGRPDLVKLERGLSRHRRARRRRHGAGGQRLAGGQPPGLPALPEPGRPRTTRWTGSSAPGLARPGAGDRRGLHQARQGPPLHPGAAAAPPVARGRGPAAGAHGRGRLPRLPARPRAPGQGRL